MIGAFAITNYIKTLFSISWLNHYISLYISKTLRSLIKNIFKDSLIVGIIENNIVGLYDIKTMISINNLIWMWKMLENWNKMIKKMIRWTIVSKISRVNN